MRIDYQRVKNILGVWLILTIFHFSVYGATALKKLASHSQIEFARIESALTDKPINEQKIGSARSEKKKQTMIERVLEFPLIPILTRRQPGKEYYHAITIPIQIRFLNSMAAGFFWYCVGFFITAFLPASSRWRRFFEGRGKSAKDIPRVFKRGAPVLGMADFLERSQSTRYGTVVVVGFFHLLLTGASQIFAVASRFDGGATDGIFAQIMRLPLTPLLVGEKFWRTQFQSGWPHGIVSMANSALVGVLVAVTIKLLKGGDPPNDEEASAEQKEGSRKFD
jgi:hypothetical protein